MGCRKNSSVKRASTKFLELAQLMQLLNVGRHDPVGRSNASETGNLYEKCVHCEVSGAIINGDNSYFYTTHIRETWPQFYENH